MYRYYFINWCSKLLVCLGSGGGSEILSREAEGQQNLDKFSSVGRNSLSLDIFSPVTDGNSFVFLIMSYNILSNQFIWKTSLILDILICYF